MIKELILFAYGLMAIVTFAAFYIAALWRRDEAPDLVTVLIYIVEALAWPLVIVFGIGSLDGDRQVDRQQFIKLYAILLAIVALGLILANVVVRLL